MVFTLPVNVNIDFYKEHFLPVWYQEKSFMK